MTVRHERHGEFPFFRDVFIADTRAELLAIVPQTQISEGWALDTGERGSFVKGKAWSLAVPGSLSAPFTTTAARDAAFATTLPPYLGYTVYWIDVAGQPPVQGQWIGPGAGDWGGASFGGAVTAPNSISSFRPGQTDGVPDTATLAVAAGVSQRVALPTGTAFRLDWSGFGPFAFRFGGVTTVAVDTDFPGRVGLPQYFVPPVGATHIAVYGIGGGTLIVSGGSQPSSAIQSVGGIALTYDMPNFRKKFAGVRANAGDCILGFVGDSHNAAAAAGTGTGYLWSGAYRYAPAHLLSRLLDDNGYLSTHDGYFGQRGETVGLPAFDPLWTMAGGTWTYANGGNKAIGNGILRCTAISASPATATRTTEKPWNVCDVWINAGANWTGVIALTAVGAATVNYGFSGKSSAFTKLTITKSAVDMNPLVIQCTAPIELVSGFDVAGIAAVDFKDSTKSQIRVHNHAIGGAGMTTHLSTASPGACFNAYQAIGMDLLVIESWINEARANTPVGTWIGYWTTFLNTFDTAARDILVLIGFPADPTTEVNIVANQEPYVTALKALLDARQINMMDMRTVYGQTYARALSEGLMHDGYHPNKTAHALKAAYLFRALMDNMSAAFQ